MEKTSVPLATWRAIVHGRCPHCGIGALFDGWLGIQERCRRCGLRYETSSGAWIGAVAIGYALGAIVVVGLASVELIWSPIRSLDLSAAWTILVLAVVITGAGYRWAKAAWFALLYLGEFMAMGDDPPGPASASTGGSLPREPGRRRVESER